LGGSWLIRVNLFFLGRLIASAQKKDGAKKDGAKKFQSLDTIGYIQHQRRTNSFTSSKWDRSMKNTMIHNVFNLGLLLAISLAVGCYGESVESEPKKIGGKDSGKKDNDPNDGGVSPKGGEAGEMTGDDSESVDATPIAAKDFPMPTGAGEPMLNPDTSTLMFHQEVKLNEQVKFYEDNLGKLGWKKQDSSEVADGVAFLDFKKGKLTISVTINPTSSGSKSLTTIAQGDGIQIPQSDDQDDDDSLDNQS